MWYNKYATGCSTVGSARLLGSRGRRFKSCHPDHKNTSKKKVFTLSFLSIRSVLLFLRSKNKPQAQALEVTPQILVLRSKTNDLSPQSRNIWYNIYTSGCGAVGSAQRSGRWGRQFKSDHPDQVKNTPRNLDISCNITYTYIKRQALETCRVEGSYCSSSTWTVTFLVLGVRFNLK